MENAMQNGMVDVDAIISKVDANIPKNLKAIYDKSILSGMRIMFDKNSHQMFLDQLEKEGDMAQKMAEGIISLMYMLWTQSNKTLPPQIVVPVTVVLTLRAYDFLQKSGEPGADKAMLGEAVALATTGIMERFGVTEDKLPELVKAQQQPKQGGLINAKMEGK